MKDPSYSRVVDILREKELELFAIRSNFEELQNKFLQLENAFGINLRVQKRLESELELCKIDKAPGTSNTNFVDKVEEETLKARTVLYSRLTKVRIEKERWKEAFLHQKKITCKQKLEHEQSIEIIRDECEKILKTCRESGEKHFRDLLELYEDSSLKARHFEEALDASLARASSTRDRILEVANLLETLEKFQGVRTEVVCQRAAKALRSLGTEGEKLYEEDMNHLRQVTWDVNENDKNDETLEFLQAQNSVLRQVVKSLKRKFQLRLNEVSTSDENPNAITKIDTPEENLREFGEEDENAMVLHHETEQAKPVKDVEKSTIEAQKISRENKDAGCAETSVSPRISGTRSNFSNEITSDGGESQRESKQSVKRDRTLKRIYVDAFESHRNGIPCEEYTFHFFNDREIRVRHSKKLATSDSTMIVEFVDSEKDFEAASIDRTVFYLGENVKKIVSLNDPGVNCCVQTNRVKTLEKFIQTSVTGTSGCSRVNAGVGILNSEKRAMERSLVNLECTVAGLKASALGQARSMIERNVKVLGDEFFDCLKRLER